MQVLRRRQRHSETTTTLRETTTTTMPAPTPSRVVWYIKYKTHTHTQLLWNAGKCSSKYTYSRKDSCAQRESMFIFYVCALCLRARAPSSLSLCGKRIHKRSAFPVDDAAGFTQSVQSTKYPHNSSSGSGSVAK